MKQPAFGLPGGEPQWCAAHKPVGAVDVVSKRCRHAGCEKHPGFGLPGEKAQWCAAHKPVGAVNVVNKRWCAAHKPTGAVNLNNKRRRHLREDAVPQRRKRTATTARKASTAASPRPGSRVARGLSPPARARLLMRASQTMRSVPPPQKTFYPSDVPQFTPRFPPQGDSMFASG